MKTPRISIIVPVYKAEKYINQCIDSILNQTFTDFELLLINDGSPDKSGQICEKYAILDNRIQVLNKENSGVSETRNMGLEKAKGEWIIFVDSDDWLVSDCLETCIEFVRNNDIDLLQFNFSRINDAHKVLFNSKGQTPILNNYDYIKENKLIVTACGNFLRNSIIKKFNIKFASNIKLGEDQLFIYEYILHANTCLRIPNILYFYRWNPHSATMSPKSSDCINSIITFQSYKKRNLFETQVEKNICSWLFSIAKEHKQNISVMHKLVQQETFALVRPKRKIQRVFLTLWNINKRLAITFLYFMYKFI